MSNKSLASFAGLFSVVVIALVILVGCSSPVAPQSDTTVVIVKIDVQNFSYVDFYAFRIGQDSTYQNLFSGSTRDTILDLKKSDFIIINAHVIHGDYPTKFSLTIENDTTLLF
jgi:hypothetical protein